MFEKIKEILGSVRFWQITLGAGAVYAGLVIANGFDLPVLLNAIAAWLGTVAGIGTFDRAAEKIGKRK